MEKTNVVGQTKDAGFQIGVRKTFPVSVNHAWDFLFSDTGLSVWLGEVDPGNLELTKTYKTKDGTEYKPSILKPYSHIRLTWRKKGWDNTSIVQMRVLSSKEKTIISFHQEKLTDSHQRAEMKAHWDKIIARISSYLN
jgi:uncharacterized protein YndB with AHSA1/START domain